MKKKLIEVALPLDDINKACALEKSIRHGHPSTLHLWWARRPLAACRAVLFAQLVDDPSSHADKYPTEEAQTKERERLFDIIRRLVLWENSNNEKVLAEAHAEIVKSCDGKPPPIYDPFSGGGSIPLEAQRLGLEAHGSDLNPVAVLIGKSLIEIPPQFSGRPPVNPEARKGSAMRSWTGAQGLAEDLNYYGKRMRDEAAKRIGHLYPTATLPKGSGEATVIAWLWARTVKCPNPACGAQMPLVRSFEFAKKQRTAHAAWAEPSVDRSVTPPGISFRIREGDSARSPPTGTVGRKGARCIACEAVVGLEYIRREGQMGRIGAQLLAAVAEAGKDRFHLAADETQESVALSARSPWEPDTSLPEKALGFRVQAYGMTRHAQLFTQRQLTFLATLCELVSEMARLVERDSEAEPAGVPIASHKEYARAVATYLSLMVDRLADSNSTICTWNLRTSSGRKPGIRNVFARQALPMTWDFAEANPFAGIAGSIDSALQWEVAALQNLPARAASGSCVLKDAALGPMMSRVVVSTDPPYYDNIGYADLSDFFYVWLRRCLSQLWPEITATLLVPKEQELIASPFRFGGGKDEARRFFERGLGAVFANLLAAQDPEYPATIFYAFKQSETDDSDEPESGDADDGSSPETFASTGWETMLEGLIGSGFLIDGTWPMRSERATRSVATGTNALASSIVLVCRPRGATAKTATRRDFLAALKNELPDALHHLQQGHIAPVDLAQSAIGPGMAIFSRYARVLESDGQPLRVRTALQLINQILDEVLSEQEGEFDADTRWAIAWFEQFGFDEGPYGQAETLSTAKNTSVNGLVEAGILKSRAGKVRLLRRNELQLDWDPATDERLTIWETTQYLVRALEKDGESAAAALLGKLGGRGDVARDLVYRLYSICERKKWAQEALAYNALVTSWADITRLAAQVPAIEPSEKQGTLL